MKDKTKTAILVASSHETTQSVIVIMLHKLGYKTTFEAGSGADAEEIIKSRSRQNQGVSALLGGGAPDTVLEIDLAIIDSELNPDSGLSYLKELRKRFKPEQLPVLFIARKDKENEVELAQAASANGAIIKPFRIEAFKNEVEAILNGKKNTPVRAFSFAEQKKEPDPPARKAATAKPQTQAQAAAPQKSSGGGASFMGRIKCVEYSPDDPTTAELVDGKIDGHYHEKVDVIGGGINCYWARQAEGEEKVLLEYISNKGKPTGMKAKEISLERFMHTFYLCDESVCPIMQRLADDKVK